MKIAILIASGIALALVTGCGTTGQTSIKTVNLVRGISSDSYSGLGLRERVLNCAAASFDSNNRGGPCSR